MLLVFDQDFLRVHCLGNVIEEVVVACCCLCYPHGRIPCIHFCLLCDHPGEGAEKRVIAPCIGVPELVGNVCPEGADAFHLCPSYVSCRGESVFFLAPGFTPNPIRCCSALASESCQTNNFLRWLVSISCAA